MTREIKIFLHVKCATFEISVRKQVLSVLKNILLVQLNDFIEDIF